MPRINYEKKALSAETPIEYVRWARGLTIGRRKQMSMLWLRRHPEYTKRDLDKARYQFLDKNELNETSKRLQKKRYKEHFHRPAHVKRHLWQREDLKEVLKYLKKKNEAFYEVPDSVLAKKFKTTVYSARYLRTKVRLTLDILKATRGKRWESDDFYELAMQSTKVLYALAHEHGLI